MTGLLARAWQAVGGDPALLDRVRTTGDARGLLPSRLPALDAETAATACATLALHGVLRCPDCLLVGGGDGLRRGSGSST